VGSNPDQQGRRPQLFVGNVAAELVGEIEPKLTQRVIERYRDRCLDEPGPDGCLIGQSANVEQSSGHLVALGQQELERLDRDIVPCDSSTTTCLL
jgi:hypothetical protein